MLQQQMKPMPDAVLAKALLRAAQQLGLKPAEIASVVGIHRTAISRLKKNPSIAPDSKQGELAILLIRIARALYALTGGDSEMSQHFMRTQNKVTKGIPAEQITHIQGLMTVLQFVDAIRGKV